MATKKRRNSRSSRRSRGSRGRRSARYGNAGKPGWPSGRRPSLTEIWANGKPIVISRAGSKWSVSVMGAPLVIPSEGRLTWRGRSDFEEGKPVAKFTKDEAKGLAHSIGRYTLGLGDFVKTYIDGY